MSKGDRLGWFRRHKVATAIIVGFFIFELGYGTATLSHSTLSNLPVSKTSSLSATSKSVTKPKVITVTTVKKTTLPPKPTPKPAATPTVLLNLSGSGIENSAPFLVSKSQLTVTYTYDCSAYGDSGNFIADLEYGNQSSLNSDDQSIANTIGNGASATTTIYPQYPGKDYYLSVNSECDWTVKVTE